jgi:hypothetical protein
MRSHTSVRTSHGQFFANVAKDKRWKRVTRKEKRKGEQSRPRNASTFPGSDVDWHARFFSAANLQCGDFDRNNPFGKEKHGLSL